MSEQQATEEQQQSQSADGQSEQQLDEAASAIDAANGTAADNDANGASIETEAAPAADDTNADKCTHCELPNDPDGLHSHLRNLLTQSVAGSLVEFDAIKRHWQNFGANLPGFIATPYCSYCRMHFQGFLRYAAHCREAIDAASAAAAESADVAADSADVASDSVAQHERRFTDLVTFVCNFTDDSVAAEDQKTLAASFLCPAGRPNYDMFQLKDDFVFTNKEAGAGGGTNVEVEPPGHPLFACLVCQQPFRSIRRHLDDALWGCSTPIFRGRHNQIAESRSAHLHAWLGPEAMQQLLSVFGSTGFGQSGGGGYGDESNDGADQAAVAYPDGVKTPHCPVCGCHFSQPVSGTAGGGGGGCSRLLLHLQHDIDTPGHRELADQLRDHLLCPDGPLLLPLDESEDLAAPLIDWIGERFACPHGGYDSNNGIVEQLRASLDRRRVEAASAAALTLGGGAAAASAGVGGGAPGGATAAAGGVKRAFPGGGPGVGRKVSRMRGGGGYPPYYQSGSRGGWRRY